MHIGSMVWKNRAVTANATSSVLEITHLPTVTAMATTDQDVVIALEVSENGTDWFEAGTTVSGQTHHLTVTTAAKYARITVSDATTITAALAAKG